MNVFMICKIKDIYNCSVNKESKEILRYCLKIMLSMYNLRIFIADGRRILHRRQKHSEMPISTVDPDEDDEDDLQIDDDDRVYKNPRNLPNTHCPRDEEKAEFMVYFF